MATNTFKAATNGKWATTANWSGGHVPTASEDAIIPTGSTAKLEAGGLCRSLKIEGTGILEGNSTLTIGATAGELVPEGSFAFNIASGERIKGTVKFTFKALEAAGTLKITGFTSGSTGAIAFISTGKYELTGAVITAGGIEVGAEAGTKPTLNTKGFAVESQSLSLKNKGILKTEATVWTLTGAAAGQVVFVEGTEVTLEAGTGKFKLQNGDLKSEAALTFNEVELEGLSHEIKPTVIFTITKLILAKPNANIKFLKGSSIKIKTLEVIGSKAGEVTKVESSTAGSEWKVEFTGANTVKNLSVKDSHATGTAPLDQYEGIAKASIDVSGNTGWTFEEVGGVTPAKLELNACGSVSSATLGVTAKQPLALEAALSTSSATNAVSAKQPLPLEAAGSTSSATMTVIIRQLLPLEAAVSTSSATAAVTAKQQLLLEAAASTSSATAALTAKQPLPLNSAASTSSTTASLTAKQPLPLEPALSTSSATSALTARALLTLAAASSTSSAEATVTVSTSRLLPLEPAASTSSASAAVTARQPLPLNSALSKSSATGAVSAKQPLTFFAVQSQSSAQSLGLTAGSSSAYEAAVKADGPSHLWKLDETGVPGVAVDTISAANGAYEANGAATVTLGESSPVPGGRSAKLAGDGNFGTGAASVALPAGSANGTTEFTLEILADELVVPALEARVWSNVNESDGMNGYYVSILPGGEIVVYATNGATNMGVKVAGKAISTGTFRHLMVIYKGSEPAASRIKVVLDGVSQPVEALGSGFAPASIAYAPEGSYFPRIGSAGGGFNNTYGINAKLTEAAYYPVALTVAQGKFHFESIGNTGGAISLALNTAASTSSASLGLITRAALPLEPAASTSNATLALATYISLPLNTAASKSSASGALTAAAKLVLTSVLSTSTATLVLTTGTTTPAVLALNPAASVSSVSPLAMSTRILLGLEPAASVSSASLLVSRKQPLPLEPASSTSSASLVLHAFSEVVPGLLFGVGGAVGALGGAGVSVGVGSSTGGATGALDASGGTRKASGEPGGSVSPVFGTGGT